MINQFPALIIIIPLFSALIVAILGWINRKYCFPFTAVSLIACLYCSVSLLLGVMGGEKIGYNFAGWPPPIGIVYNIDYLSSVVLVVIFSLALIYILTIPRVSEEEFSDKTGTFHSLYILFVAGLAGMVATADAFNLYVLLEITALSGYALIGLGEERAPLSGLNYVLIGTIGASFYLLGVGYLYIATGSLNMADIAARIQLSGGSTIITSAFVICLTGLFIKMALFPLHSWLPNAYSHAPLSSTGIIASLTTKVMIYVMVRIVLYVFTPEFSFSTKLLSEALVWLSIVAILSGALLALAQKNLKKMLTYIIVSEVGYMVGGFWLGNRMGISGSILHIINDAVMTMALFMGVAVFGYKIDGDRIEDFQGRFIKMPVTMTAFTVAGLSVVGVPPTCGFFSKWYLISGGIEAGHYAYVAALLISSLINAVLFFRIFEIAYFEPFHGEETEGGVAGSVPVKLNEAPPDMLVPLILTAVLLIVLGIYSGEIITRIIHYAIPAGIV